MPDAAKGTSAPSEALAGPGTLWLYAITTFVSAILLFSVQPLFAKMVLPVLGGAPSVWAVALCFFQGALLAGYCYAHLLISRLPIEATGVVHLGVCLLAFVALPIALPAWASEPPAGDAYLWQLGLFTVAIGLPFAAVAANAPLVQAWFARTGHPQSADPYFLYAASNLGSLLALLGYPLVLEPAFGLSALSRSWSIGYGALVALLAACFWIVRKRVLARGAFGAAPAKASGTSATASAEAPGWGERAFWVLLSLVPAALLTAFTTHVATDLASAPLIWVIPLALYLLTFVIVFRDRALVPAWVLLPLHLAAVVLTLLLLSQIRHETWYLSAALGTAAFFLSALVAHRTLYEQRPAAAHLTSFYLFMSLGGALGGVFASIIAPKIFSEVLEYPLLLALSFACRPGALAVGKSGSQIEQIGAVAAGGLVTVLFLPWAAGKLGLEFHPYGATAIVTLLLALALMALWRKPPLQLATAIAMFAAVSVLPSAVHRGRAERSYFGVYRVVLSEDGEFNVLQHGTTLHGAQHVKDAEGRPVADTTPCTYYHPNGPMAQSIGRMRMALAQEGRQLRVGIVGLGAGALACHAGEGESWRFYEIDPLVVAIAKSPHFTYLSTCQKNADVVVGDARLTLAKEKDARFDVLVIDAFSSDAIPMHLITAEALALYASKIAPDGLVVLHISNRYLDLEAVVSATIAKVEGVRALAIDDPSRSDGYKVTPSTVVFMGRDQHTVMQFLRMRGARTLNWTDMRPWTDDSSDIVGPFLARWRRHG